MNKSNKNVLEQNRRSKISLSRKSEDRLSKLSMNISERRMLSRAMIPTMMSSRYLFHKRDKLRIPKYQNTYRLEPFRAFNVEVVDKIVTNQMESKLTNVTSYNPDEAIKLCKEISMDVLRNIDKRDYDRCKLVVQVNISQRYQQSFNVGFECLWDLERDNYSSFVFENPHIHAWCLVFGLYYE